MITTCANLINFVLASTLAVTAFAQTPQEKLQTRSGNAAETLTQLLTAPDRTAPTSLLKNASCIAVIPQVIKGGFLVGATYGRGLVSCRNGDDWGAPEFLMITGGSFGFQAGVDTIDLVLIFVHPTARDVVSKGSFTLGVSASIAAGPVGRDLRAGVDYKLDSDIYSYSRAQGVFAGVAFEGTVIEPDKSADELLYGTTLTSSEILSTPGSSAPHETETFMQTLKSDAPR